MTESEQLYRENLRARLELAEFSEAVEANDKRLLEEIRLAREAVTRRG